MSIDPDAEPTFQDDVVEDPVNPAVPKWVKSASWIGSVVIALPMLYLFVYPAMAMLIFKALGRPTPVPTLLNKTIIPIEWAGEHIETYEKYTDWLGDLILSLAG